MSKPRVYEFANKWICYIKGGALVGRGKTIEEAFEDYEMLTERYKKMLTIEAN